MSCGVIFLSENLTDNANISITTGTVNAQFPLNNIKNDSPAVKFRSTTNTVVLVFDLLQLRKIDTIALHGDTNATLGLTAASVKTSLTTDFSSSTAIPITLSAKYLMGFEFITEVSHRYVELTLTGTGSFVELSNIFIGERIEIEQNNLSIRSFRYGLRDNSTVSSNQYDQMFIDDRNATKFVSGNIEFCTKSEQEIIDSLFIRHRRSKTLWMIVDRDGAGMNDGKYKLTTYGYFQRVSKWSGAGGQHFSAQVRVNQAG